MYDLIASLSAGTLVMCLANLYFSIGIQLNQEYEPEDQWQREKHMFVMGVTCFCIFAFFQSFSFLLKDAHIITTTTDNKIGLIGRFFAVASTVLFFLTLSLGINRKRKTIIIIGAIVTTIAMYLFKAI